MYTDILYFLFVKSETIYDGSLDDAVEYEDDDLEGDEEDEEDEDIEGEEVEEDEEVVQDTGEEAPTVSKVMNYLLFL